MKIIRFIFDKIIVLLACCFALLYLLLICPIIWAEKKLFNTRRIDDIITDWVSMDDSGYPSRCYIYTEDMYRSSFLPQFYFTKEFSTRRGLMPFKKGELYPTYAYSYKTLIKYLNQGIITTNPEV